MCSPVRSSRGRLPPSPSSAAISRLVETMRTTSLSLLLLCCLSYISVSVAVNVREICTNFCIDLIKEDQEEGISLETCVDYCAGHILARLEEESAKPDSDWSVTNELNTMDKRKDGVPQRRVSSFVRIGRANPSSFVRIGKARPSSFVRIGKARPSSFVRIGKARPSSFVRIGKARPSSFVRIGKKDDEKYFNEDMPYYDESFPREDGEKRASSFVRIGRSAGDQSTDELEQFLRQAKSRSSSSFVRIGKSGEGLDEDKRASSFVRIGKSSKPMDNEKRASSFVRIGKSGLYPNYKRLSSFVRIGKSDQDGQLIDGEEEGFGHEKRASSFVRIGKAVPSQVDGLEEEAVNEKRASSFVRIGKRSTE